MRRVFVGISIVAALSGGATRTSSAADEKPLVERVNAAIDRGIEALKKRQRADGSWGDTKDPGARSYAGGTDVYDFPAGPSAFALYALLKCGVPPDDAVVQKGFAFLHKFDKVEGSTYEVAATILAVEAKYDQVKREAKREAASGFKTEPGKRPDLRVKPSKDDAAWLARLVQAIDDRCCDGGWRYFRPTGDKAFGAKQDQSATAIAMLAVLAAHRCGVDLPRKTTAAAIQWTLKNQDATGPAAKPPAKPTGAGATWAPPVGATVRGWPYLRKSTIPDEIGGVTGNMTTAGIIALLAGQHVLEDIGPETLKALQPSIDKSIGDGIAWLAEHWRIDRNPDGEHYHYMYLYGLERIGDLRRVALIGGHDWYTEGAKLLVADQRDDGSWLKNDTHPPYDVLNTSFALLFLDRASLAVTTPK